MPSLTALTPLSSLKVTRHLIPAHGNIPNTSIQNRPLTFYHNVFASPDMEATQVEEHIKVVGVFAPRWRYPMYPASHFHSTSHEFLIVVSGRARLLFGGDDNPESVTFEAQKGDAVMIPAGVAHKLAEDLSAGSNLGSSFEMVGAYPKDSEHWDMCYGDGRKGEDYEVIRETIKELSWVEGDPIYGQEGPLVQS